MEAAAVDRLVQKGEFRPEVAQAIGEAIDVAIKVANVVTIPVFDARLAAQDAKVDARFAAHEARVDARFAAHEAKVDARFAALEAKVDARFVALEAKMEVRFGSIEKSIESTKVWAALLYAGLTLTLFSALAVDHHWLVNREDQLIAQVQTRTDARFAEQQARSDRRFEQVDAKLDQIRALMLSTPLTRDSLTHPSPTNARPRKP